jgi:hypothetical protein
MRLRELSSVPFRVRAITAIQSSQGAAAVRLSPARVIRCVICAGFIVLFVWSSVPSVMRALAGPFPNRIDAFHSSNAYLQAITGSANASERIIDVMDSLPPEKPLLIFEREKDSSSSLLGMALAYLAWPRDVQIETVVGPRCDQQLARIAPNSISGVAFCDVQPPSWMSGGMRLGQNSKLIAFTQPAVK